VAYQIKNDLDDWQPDQWNKLTFGADLLQNRPTLLRAMAEFPIDSQKESVQFIFEQFQQTGVFDKAQQLITRCADKAYTVAKMIDHIPLRNLLYHFIELIAET
jgi:geranylgeranyl pyrophosphate synthase